jgi:hypothetical protein
MIQIADSGGAAIPFAGSTNTFYLIFLLIAIVGYFTIPSIAGYIIQVGGHALFSKVAAVSSGAVSMYTGAITRELSSAVATMSKESSNITDNNFHSSGSRDRPAGSSDYKSGRISGNT